MKIGVLGHTGFVGSHIYEKYPDAIGFNSQNIETVRNQHFDLLFCACIPAVKWIANRDPDHDQQQIEHIQSLLHTVDATEFILISTIDAHCDTEPYGRHRNQFEQWCMAHFDNRCRIIRLPALFGIGLKKNALFDLLNHRFLDRIHPDSHFQWYDLRDLNGDIQEMRRLDLRTVYAYSDPISMRQICDTFFGYDLSGTNVVNYDYPTLQPFFRRSVVDIMDKMRRFIDVWHGLRYYRDRIVVSNLHWSPDHTSFALHQLRRYNVEQIESVFNNCIIASTAIRVTSIQSILYGIDPNPDAILAQLHRVAETAASIGATVLVLGAPKLRRSPLTREDWTDLLRRYRGAVTIAFEPNAADYGCQYGTTLAEVVEWLAMIGNDRIRINLDYGNRWMSRDQTVPNWSAGDIAHIQISAAHLDNLDAEILRTTLATCPIPTSYTGRISLEVNRPVDTLAQNLYTMIAELYRMRRTFQRKCLVIGAGWYGCYITNCLRKLGYNCDITDKTDRIMTASSRYNQNRLHLGFHYPRNYRTRLECMKGYKMFMQQFGQLTSELTNIYAISQDSIVDQQTYRNIYTYEQVPYEYLDKLPESVPVQIQHIEPGYILQQERYIDPDMAAAYWARRLTLKPWATVDPNEYEWIIDMTYGNYVPFVDSYREDCLTLIYRAHCPTTIGITIMDGPFFSIYPYNISEQLYTVTHVRYTPMIGADWSVDQLRELMEQDIRKYIPDFTDHYTYHSYYISSKTKFRNQTSDRSLQFQQTGNVYSFMGGKITGIFGVWDYLSNELI